jgi:hypothetical protein
MRLYCIFCKTWLSGEGVCEVLPAGTLWPVGGCLCVQCCVHALHGIPTPCPGTGQADRQAA